MFHHCMKKRNTSKYPVVSIGNIKVKNFRVTFFPYKKTCIPNCVTKYMTD